MKSEDLEVGDWIRIPWIAYKLYVVETDDKEIRVASPSWKVNERMRFRHWQFIRPPAMERIGKSKPNPLYNKITKLTGFVHPVTLNTRP